MMSATTSVKQAARWFYLSADGALVGPITGAALQRLATAGIIVGGTSLMKLGMKGYRPARECKGLVIPAPVVVTPTVVEPDVAVVDPDHASVAEHARLAYESVRRQVGDVREQVAQQWASGTAWYDRHFPLVVRHPRSYACGVQTLRAGWAVVAAILLTLGVALRVVRGVGRVMFRTVLLLIQVALFVSVAPIALIVSLAVIVRFTGGVK